MKIERIMVTLSTEEECPLAFFGAARCPKVDMEDDAYIRMVKARTLAALESAFESFWDAELAERRRTVGKSRLSSE